MRGRASTWPSRDAPAPHAAPPLCPRPPPGRRPPRRHRRFGPRRRQACHPRQARRPMPQAPRPLRLRRRPGAPPGRTRAASADDACRCVRVGVCARMSVARKLSIASTSVSVRTCARDSKCRCGSGPGARLFGDRRRGCGSARGSVGEGARVLVAGGCRRLQRFTHARLPLLPRERWAAEGSRGVSLPAGRAEETGPQPRAVAPPDSDSAWH